MDSWLIWNLTGGAAHVTDYSNASRTMLFNIHTLQWDEALCRALGIPASLLPEPLPNCHLYGRVAPDIPGLEDLAGIPICGSAGDQPGGPVRPGLLHAGPGEEHLRHRLLHADECGR